MLERNVKIVTDSSSDLYELGDFPFASAALKIVTANKEYVDDANLDVEGMVNDLLAYKGKSSTSCPSILTPIPSPVSQRSAARIIRRSFSTPAAISP